MEKNLVIGLLFGLELFALLLWGLTRLTDDLTAFLASWGRFRSALRRRRSSPHRSEEEGGEGR